MVQINFALREVNCKIVYYGPGMSGKTTNLEIVHKKAPESNKGELTSIATEGDRTLFFDFMPLDLGMIAGMRTRFQLYTVPGQVYYNSTRKLVLQGVDGIVFVADSSASKMEENLESLENLKNNLAEYGKDIRELPLVLQWNKRDLPDALSVEELEARLNQWGVPTFEAVAITGEGVFPTLKCLSGMVLETLNRDQREAPAGVAAAAPAAAAAASASTTGSFGAQSSGTSQRFRAGALFQQYAPAGLPSAAAATAQPPTRPTGPQHSGGPNAGGGLSASGGMSSPGGLSSSGGMGMPQWQPPRKQIDATPLEAAARTTPAGGPKPKIQIREEKRVPWLGIGLAAMILVALGVIIFATGLVKVAI